MNIDSSILSFGDEFPFDGSDDGQAPAAVDWAHRAARGVICDLQDRNGIKWGFQDVDEEVRVEIVASLSRLIRQAKQEDAA